MKKGHRNGVEIDEKVKHEPINVLIRAISTILTRRHTIRRLPTVILPAFHVLRVVFRWLPSPLSLSFSLFLDVCVCVCVCVRAHSERTKNFDARVRQSRPQAYKAHFPEILQYIYVNYRYIKISPARAVEKIYGKKAQHFSSNAVTYNSWNNLAARQSWIISLDTPASQKASAKREISLFLVYLVSCLRSWK